MAEQKEAKRPIGLAFGVVFLIGVGLLFVYGSGFLDFDSERQSEFENEQEAITEYAVYENGEIGVRLDFPKRYAETEMTIDQVKAGIFFYLLRDKPFGLFSLRRQTDVLGLKAGGSTIMDALVEEINKRYPERFPEYKKENYEELVLANEQAVVFEFTYLGADKETRARQRLVVLVKDGIVYFLSAQSADVDFPELEAEFTQMIESFEFIN